MRNLHSSFLLFRVSFEFQPVAWKLPLSKPFGHHEELSLMAWLDFAAAERQHQRRAVLPLAPGRPTTLRAAAAGWAYFGA